MRKHLRYLGAGLFMLSGICACSSDRPVGPDRAGGGVLEGMASGATTGAITGFQLGGATGPGAFIGLGFGAVAGSLHGLGQDEVEKHQIVLEQKLRKQQERAYAYSALLDHYSQREALYPSRDIFPADVFFAADGNKIKFPALPIVHELATLQSYRMPWSKIIIASYVRSADKDSSYAVELASRRAESLGDEFVRQGIEARRIEPRAILIDEPLVIDPNDDPLRYNQAIELILQDR